MPSEWLGGIGASHCEQTHKVSELFYSSSWFLSISGLVYILKDHLGNNEIPSVFQLVGEWRVRAVRTLLQLQRDTEIQALATILQGSHVVPRVDNHQRPRYAEILKCYTV